MDYRKVNLFLKELSEDKRIYLRHCLDISDSIINSIKKYKLSKKEICSGFKISESLYDDFVSGNYNYSLVDIANLDALIIMHEIEIIKKSSVVKIGKDEEK